ncbi:hypothetical protein MHU86_20682 [Fragilaria crotonensis]|nr:hypothetical protein MHU86_20682 [Fragilaria crotonensis]
MVQSGTSLRWIVLLTCLNFGLARFAISGPVLTITLKDPDAEGGGTPTKWADLSALRPTAQWSVQSRDPPLPHWLPLLKSIRASLGYSHAEGGLPSTVDSEWRFAKDGYGDLDIQPSYHFKQKRTTCIIQATKGNTASIIAKVTFGGKRILEGIKGNFMLNLPSSISVSALKVSPSFDFTRNTPSCTLEGITGSGRTKAILNLQYEEPTLSVVHAIDERNVISPEISLHTAKIVYNWNIRLESGSIRTKVDPTEAIHVTWTDRSMNGRWVTDCSLPLKGTSLKALAAKVRVRRQFTF